MWQLGCSGTINFFILLWGFSKLDVIDLILIKINLKLQKKNAIRRFFFVTLYSIIKKSLKLEVGALANFIHYIIVSIFLMFWIKLADIANGKLAFEKSNIIWIWFFC